MMSFLLDLPNPSYVFNLTQFAPLLGMTQPNTRRIWNRYGYRNLIMGWAWVLANPIHT